MKLILNVDKVNLKIILFGIIWVIFGVDSESSVHGYNNRVFGGNNVTDILAPYQVSLQNLNRSHVCGGAIIGQKWIITAAHCLVNALPQYVLVRTGSNVLSDNNGQYYKADKLVNHPEFMGINLQNDIGLIRLSTPIVLNKHTQIIAFENLEEPKQGDPMLLTGWGLTTPISFSDILQSLNLKYMNTKTCGRLMKDKLGALITNTQICTYNKIGDGSCRGDSGGPLAYKGKLVGLVSWGVPCALGLPDIFTRLSLYEEFILETMKTYKD